MYSYIYAFIYRYVNIYKHMYLEWTFSHDDVKFPQGSCCCFFSRNTCGGQEEDEEEENDDTYFDKDRDDGTFLSETHTYIQILV